MEDDLNLYTYRFTVSLFTFPVFQTMFTLPTQEVYTTPVPVPEDPAGNIKDDCRLWIGNLDTRLTEYDIHRNKQENSRTILKFVKKYNYFGIFNHVMKL